MSALIVFLAVFGVLGPVLRVRAALRPTPYDAPVWWWRVRLAWRAYRGAHGHANPPLRHVPRAARAHPLARHRHPAHTASHDRPGAAAIRQPEPGAGAPGQRGPARGCGGIHELPVTPPGTMRQRPPTPPPTAEEPMGAPPELTTRIPDVRGQPLADSAICAPSAEILKRILRGNSVEVPAAAFQSSI